jgi:hypothetical protein
VQELALEREDFQSIQMKFLDEEVGNFQALPYSFPISRAIFVFNSVSYSTLVRQNRDVSHYQAQTLSFHQKTVFSRISFFLKRKNLLPTQFCFIASVDLSCRSLTKLCSVACGKLKKTRRFEAAHFLVPLNLSSCLFPFGVPFFLQDIYNII